jgi:hypothetical protein
VTREDVIAFSNALKEDMVTTVKWLFYLRDVREGLGERDSFVTLFLALNAYDEEVAMKVLPLVPEFGRWKDVVDILSKVGEGTNISNVICDLIGKQIKEVSGGSHQGKTSRFLSVLDQIAAALQREVTGDMIEACVKTGEVRDQNALLHFRHQRLDILHGHIARNLILTVSTLYIVCLKLIFHNALRFNGLQYGTKL